MPVSARLVSKRTTPGCDDGFSVTTIDWPIRSGWYRGPGHGLPSTQQARPDAPSPNGDPGVGTVAAVSEPHPRRSVDVRYVATTTLVVVAVVIASTGSILAVSRLWRVVTYLLVALFGAVVLTPAVDLLQRRARLRRGLATAVVFLAGLVVLAGLVYAFVKPLVVQGEKFSDDFPTLVDDAEKGKGPVGELVKKYDLQDWVREHHDQIDDQISRSGTRALDMVQTVFSGVVAGVTVMVLTILLLLGGPELSHRVPGGGPESHRERVPDRCPPTPPKRSPATCSATC